MRKTFFAAFLVIATSLCVIAQSTPLAAADPSRLLFRFTLYNLSDACVWLTLYDGQNGQMAAEVLPADQTFRYNNIAGNNVKVRAQFYPPKAGCHGKFFEDRYDYITSEGYSFLTIRAIGKSYIMRPEGERRDR